MKRYSISIVYQKQGLVQITTWLRVMITDANSKDEALGKAIHEFEEETKGYVIINKVVVPTEKETDV